MSEKTLFDLADEYLGEVDTVFKHVNKGLNILQRADDLAGELANPDEPCTQGDESDDE